MNDPPTALVGFGSERGGSFFVGGYERSTNCVGGIRGQGAAVAYVGRV
jgi:hypothetical protein